jgi:hypothetical protein
MATPPLLYFGSDSSQIDLETVLRCPRASPQHLERKKAPALADRSPDNLSIVRRHGFSFESPQRFVAFFEIESHDAV